MRKGFLFALILLCCYTPGSAQNKAIDSLTNVLKDNSLADTLRADVLYEISHLYYNVNRNYSKDYATQGLELSQRIGYPKGIAGANFSLATWHYDRNDGEKSMQHVLKALEIYKQLNHSRGKASSWLLIGRNFMRAKEMKKATSYFKLALAEHTLADDRNRMAILFTYLGLAYEDLKNYDSALHFYRQHLDIRTQEQDVSGMLLGFNNVGATYTRLQRYDLAKENLMRGLGLSRNSNNKDRIATLHRSMGDLYFAQQRYDEARLHYDSSLTLVEAGTNFSRKEEIYSRLKDLHLRTRNHEQASLWLTKLLAVKDSLYDADRFSKLAELETYYESEKKAQTIALLEREKHIEALWRNILLGSVIVATGAAVIIFLLQRSRSRKAQELLAVHQQLNDKLKEVDKLKSRFFANISHEFRTPLTLVLAPLEEQMKKAVTEDERERLTLIRRNANRLLELVNQLLDLSKLEAGKMDLYVRKGKIDLFLKAIASSFDSWAHLKEIHFVKTFQVADDPLWYDQDKIEKITTNLLANAFKFTPANGTVTFSTSLTGGEVTPYLQISVNDTGKGIPDDEQEQVFLPFYQTKERSAAHYGGTGLGLSLVKELVKLYNGEITLKSKTGEGTTICVKIPVYREAFDDSQAHEGDDHHSLPLPSYRATPELQDIAQELEQSEAGRDCVLIVEDNADLRQFMTTVLQEKFSVFTASEGAEAFRMALKHVPNLVLTDLMMPGMDGMQLTEKLKHDERTSHIPVVLVTAKNEQQSKLESLRTGADDYMTKPFSTEELLVRITNLVEQRKLLAEKFKERVLVEPTVTTDISLDNRFLLRMREIVEANMGDPSFSVEQMADEAHLSRTQLLRKLKALTGTSPNEFIKELRLKRAAEMISQRVDNITQIGYSVGFNDQSYFSKCFKNNSASRLLNIAWSKMAIRSALLFFSTLASV